MRTFSSFEYEDLKAYKFGYDPIRKPSYHAHIYYLDGLLIDTGQSHMRKMILKHIKPLDVKQIFITHYHEDHSGNVHALSDHFGSPVYGSAMTAEIMKAPPKISFAQHMTWGDRPAFHKIIPEDQKITTDKYEFELIPIPGHAPDMLALYEPNKKWLFSADLFLNSFISYFVQNESMIDQINSIKRVLAYDFEIMLCCHNPKFENAREHLQKKLKFLEAFYSSVKELYDQGLNAETIFKKLRLKELWFVKIMSGGHLSKINMVRSVIRDIRASKAKQPGIKQGS